MCMILNRLYRIVIQGMGILLCYSKVGIDLFTSPND